MAEWFKELGIQIEQARTKAKLTQAQLGDQTGLSRQTIITYESGTAKKLSFEIILGLARALETQFTVLGCTLTTENRRNGHGPQSMPTQFTLPFDEDRVFPDATVTIRATSTGILIIKAEAQTG